MLGLFLLFAIWVLLRVQIQVFLTPNLYWAVGLFLWLLHLLGLAHRISVKRYRYVIPWFFILLCVFWGLSALEGTFPNLGVWGKVFISGLAIAHALLMLASDNLLKRASTNSHAWFVLHNLLFIFATGWFLLFHRLFWGVFVVLVLFGGVSLYLGLLLWNKKSRSSFPMIDTSYLLLLSAVYLVMMAGIVKLIYLYNLNLRVFLSALLGILLGLLGIILLFGDGIRRWVEKWIKILFGYEQIDMVREWDDFVSTIEDLMDEDEIMQRVRSYLKDRYRIEDVILFWKSENAFLGAGMCVKLPEELERYMWYKDAVIVPNELWRYGASIDVVGPDDLVVPMVFRKSLVGFWVLKNSIHSKLPGELAVMMARNLAVMLTLVKLSREVVEMRQFEQFNKMVSFLIHDMKNAISGLKLLIGNWERNRTNPEFLDDAYQTLLTAVGRMEHVVDRLTSYRLGRVPAEKKEWVDVLDVVKDVIKGLNLKATKVDLVLSGKTGLNFLCNRIGFSRIIENLILNAIDAVREKGEGRVYISVEEDEDDIVLVVKDEGIGMEEDFIRKKLFRPFVSTKRRGLGIGMYEVKALLERYGGKISVQSQSNIGTRVEIRLPKSWEKRSGDETQSFVS